jgi:hypothetical protein
MFALNPDIRPTAPISRKRKSTLNMHSQLFQKFTSDEVTDEMLEEASQLFSENYGTWSERASKVMGAFAKAGKSAHITMFTPGN